MNRQSVPIRACTREEVEMLHLYRRADHAGKKLLEKAMVLALQDKLPSAEVIRTMTPGEVRAMVESLGAAA